MREIDNKIGFGNAQPPRNDVRVKPEEVTAQPINEEKLEQSTKDLNSGNAIGGRSLVTEAGALKETVAFGMKHPEKIQSADRFFDMAFNSLAEKGDPEAYPKAAAMTEIFLKEFADR